MQKTLDKTGLTLTELLISITIIGIIMIGIMSVDYALRQSHESVSKDTQVKMRLAAISLDITNTISRAVGNQSDPGIGIIEPAIDGDPWELFVRQEGGDPLAYEADDPWIWFRHEAAGTLWKCTDTDVGFPTIDFTTATCDVVERNMGSLRYILPTALGGPTDQYVFAPNATTHELFVEVHLESLYDNSIAFHPITNPSGGVIDTNVIPFGHTW